MWVAYRGQWSGKRGVEGELHFNLSMRNSREIQLWSLWQEGLKRGGELHLVWPAVAVVAVEAEAEMENGLESQLSISTVDGIRCVAKLVNQR